VRTAIGYLHEVAGIGLFSLSLDVETTWRVAYGIVGIALYVGGRELLEGRRMRHYVVSEEHIAARRGLGGHGTNATREE